MPREPRSPARVVVDVVLFGVAAFAALFLAAMGFSKAAGGASHPVAFSWLTAAVALAVTWLFLIRPRRYQNFQLGLFWEPRMPRDAVGGALLGVALAAAAAGLAGLAGGAQLTGRGGATPMTLIPAAFGLVGAALAEETLFRAALIGPLATAFPRWIAIVAPAALFGVVHLRNPGASFVSTMGTIVAGLALGFAFFEPDRTPSLAGAVGLHFGWNAALGLLFGGTVSGFDLGPSVLVLEARDRLWSGGSYGLEAGLASLLVWSALTAWLVFRSRDRLATVG